MDDQIDDASSNGNVSGEKNIATEALHAVETNNARPACFKSTIQEVLFVLTCTMAIAMPAYVAGMITVISSFVGRDLDMTTAEITWLTSSTSLASGAFLLFFGGVADLFGRKAMFIVSMFFFAVFTLAAGFAKTPIGIDVLSGVMGLFAAMAVPPAVGLLGAIYKPSKRKNLAFACFSGGNPLGFVFGTIFSGVATSIFNWRASFYLLAIIFVLFSVIGWFTIPSDHADKQPLTWQTIRRFDFLGVLLTVGGIGMFSAALSLGDTAQPNGWKTGYVLALLIVGLFLMIAFVFWERYFPHALVPMDIWKDKNFSLSLGILCLGMMAFTPASFFIGLYFQEIWHKSALQVAVLILPMAIVGMIVNVIAGLILHRVSNKLLMGLGCSAYVLSCLLFAVNRASSSYWNFCFTALMFVVVGADLQFNVANMYVMSSLPREQQSVAGGILQTVSRLAQTVGFGITTSIFNSVQQKPRMVKYYDLATQPYAATFYFSMACAVMSLGLVPFLTLKTQGGKVKEGSDVSSIVQDNDAKEVPASTEAKWDAQLSELDEAVKPGEKLP
ncbi:hypothetical protein B0A48_15464 [Cryoendolithus antarcticus]|uniref:Major facilitator superfamily (MFS) profile domain-containing protein n=1 Tax=Cryoendolithus antarcticus TaxID=1507870 RepID=A0A1V8SGB9_9PEZI|nr:hypothetical protein B0A48_15464 [Cryoendolithus antarcticus]